jgi:cytochrome c-type biogenesis protein CcmF
LISSSKKEVLSHNTTGIAVFKQEKGGEDPRENITLFKGVATDMGAYMVTYVNHFKNAADRKTYYEVEFKPKDGSKRFSLFPNVIQNNKGGEGFSANPDAKHYIHKDIFAYLTSFREGETDTATFKPREMKVGDTLFYSNGRFVLNEVKLQPKDSLDKTGSNSLLVMDVTVISNNGGVYKATPALDVHMKDSMIRRIDDTVVAEGLMFSFNKLNPENGKFELGVKESKTTLDLVTLKVYEFPMINMLWLGVIVMFFGLIISMYYRISQLRGRSLIKL